jgi:hypothetical protein
MIESIAIRPLLRNDETRQDVRFLAPKTFFDALDMEQKRFARAVVAQRLGPRVGSEMVTVRDLPRHDDGDPHLSKTAGH